MKFALEMKKVGKKLLINIVILLNLTFSEPKPIRPRKAKSGGPHPQAHWTILVPTAHNQQPQTHPQC